MKAAEYAARITEADFQEKVVTLARAKGWLVHHDRRQDLGIGGDPGFPDLVLARAGVVIFAELKSNTGRQTDSQRQWLGQLAAYSEAGCGTSHHVRLWRPDDWRTIQTILSSKPGLEPL